jgi:hypothetical protein
MKTRGVVIVIILILALLCSPALAISKSALISQYQTGQFWTPVPTPTPTGQVIPFESPPTPKIPSWLPEWGIPENANVDPTATHDDTPINCAPCENYTPPPGVEPYFGPVEIVDPLHLRIQWNVSAFLPNLIKQNGPCYKSDPASPFCRKYKFIDSTSISGVKVQ